MAIRVVAQLRQGKLFISFVYHRPFYNKATIISS